jgi:phosphoenolpyruvate carboxykinase (ATP)
MATLSHLPRNQIGKQTPNLYHRIRTTIETAFYRNNVEKVTSISHAYRLAKHAPGTIVTDLPVHRPKDLQLPADAKVLLFNDGIITGRQANARRLINMNNEDEYANILREAIFQNKHKEFYHGIAYVGLHEDFMVRAHLLIPKGYENTLYSWMLNFQHPTSEIEDMYAHSKQINEGDIYLYSDPDYFVKGHDMGLSVFDHKHNVGALFGLKYFGEHKKATLTMGWSVASRCNFTSCHGGQKRFIRADGTPFIAGVFGLSGSGKSTITHSKHNGKYDITVLHDDAFIISNEDGSSVSLEPSYFDKVQDYPTDCSDNTFLLTMQNVGATLDDKGYVVPVTEDIRNGNGRALKSKFWTPHRAYKFDHKIDAIFWIMKDETLPPILKVNSSILASTLGATLATKRSSAEHGAITSKLVIEPYANPFRLYPLRNDYKKFKDLFENHQVDCYVINTGFFLDSNITPSITLSLMEQIVDNTITFQSFAGLEELEYTSINGFNPDFKNTDYLSLFAERLESRIHFIEHLYSQNVLPKESTDHLQSIVDHIKKML